MARQACPSRVWRCGGVTAAPGRNYGPVVREGRGGELGLTLLFARCIYCVYWSLSGSRTIRPFNASSALIVPQFHTYIQMPTVRPCTFTYPTPGGHLLDGLLTV